ncbi:hypothetical protein H5410_004510, partial [Solanum commersonii]
MDCVVYYDDEVAPTKNQKFYGGFIVWVYIITGSLYGGYNGTRVNLVRVMGYVASAIDRAYKIVHIIFGRRLKCFGNVLQLFNESYGRWLTSVQPEGLIALHDCCNALNRSLR